MDLNLLYSQHQGALMRASATTSRLCQARYLAAAGALADRIGDYQRRNGAPAAAGWVRNADHSGRLQPGSWA